jgi:hypothetical protein
VCYSLPSFQGSLHHPSHLPYPSILPTYPTYLPSSPVLSFPSIISSFLHSSFLPFPAPQPTCFSRAIATSTITIAHSVRCIGMAQSSGFSQRVPKVEPLFLPPPRPLFPFLGEGVHDFRLHFLACPSFVGATVRQLGIHRPPSSLLSLSLSIFPHLPLNGPNNDDKNTYLHYLKSFWAAEKNHIKSEFHKERSCNSILVCRNIAHDGPLVLRLALCINWILISIGINPSVFFSNPFSSRLTTQTRTRMNLPPTLSPFSRKTTNFLRCKGSPSDARTR